MRRAGVLPSSRPDFPSQNRAERQDDESRLADTGAEAEGRAPRGAQPSGHADEAGTVGRETEVLAELERSARAEVKLRQKALEHARAQGQDRSS